MVRRRLARVADIIFLRAALVLLRRDSMSNRRPEHSGLATQREPQKRWTGPTHLTTSEPPFRVRVRLLGLEDGSGGTARPGQPAVQLLRLELITLYRLVLALAFKPIDDAFLRR